VNTWYDLKRPHPDIYDDDSHEPGNNPHLLVMNTSLWPFVALDFKEWPDRAREVKNVRLTCRETSDLKCEVSY
jgi:hypothetical protein